ncbi:MAG: MOSC domain-containing protein, partial [Solirubrobacteraceae bacterium]
AHGEDRWVGSPLRVGSARVAFHGNVGRCLVTQLHPDHAVPDLPTLELLSYRRAASTSEPLAFGIYGEVLEEGRVAIGDTVSVE